MTLILTAINTLHESAIDWIWQDRIPMGALTLLEGDPGSTKSTLIYDLAARISSGRRMPGSTIPPVQGEVWLVSTEDSMGRIQCCLRGSAANLSKIHVLDGQRSIGPRLPTDIGQIEELIRQHSPKLVSLDPISEFIEGSTTSERSIRAALSPLCSLAAKYRFAILGVRHLTKSCPTNPMYRGGGSIALIGLARSSLLAIDDPFQSGQRVLVQVKSSFGIRARALGFKPVESNGGLSIDWLGPLDYTAEQLFAVNRETEAKALEEAAYVLYSLLGDGAILAKHAHQLGREAGVSTRTLRRAKELLGVKSIRKGFGPGSQFYWTLPSQNELLKRIRDLDLDTLMKKLLTGEDDLPSAASSPSQPMHGSEDTKHSSPQPWRDGEDEDNDEDEDPGSIECRS